MTEVATRTETAPMAEMTPGGKWMLPPGQDMPPVYVVAREHQHRLLTRTEEEGGPWLVVPDPRDPQSVRVRSEEADLAKRLAELQAQRAQRMREDEMRKQIAALEAELMLDEMKTAETVEPHKGKSKP